MMSCTLFRYPRFVVSSSPPCLHFDLEGSICGATPGRARFAIDYRMHIVGVFTTSRLEESVRHYGHTFALQICQRLPARL